MLANRAVMPAATGKVRCGVLECIMPIQPSPASQVYTVHARQRHGQDPQVTVIEPRLELHPGATSLPHVYPGDELCLFYPGQWRPDMLLSTTILPWTAEWLMYYELWLVSGHWTGGGQHSARSADGG